MPTESQTVEARPSHMRLFVRKQCWTLSWQGWLVTLIFAAGIGLGFVLGIYPFLATTTRVSPELLVVEGWVHDYAIRAAIDEFHSGQYQRIVTTGGPVEGLGGYLNDYSTSANVAASRLRAAGFPSEFLSVVPSRIAGRDRTFSSALALARWLPDHAPNVRKINIITADAHARRSRLLFQRALGDQFQVGVIAIHSPDYDSQHWWRYSEGVRTVLSETIAYIYAKFLFFPSAPSTSLKNERSRMSLV